MTDIPGSDDLAAVLRAGPAAVNPARQVAECLADDPVLQAWAGPLAATPPPRAGERPGVRSRRPRLVLLSLGTQAVSMARGAIQVLGDLVDAGIVLAPHGCGPRLPWLPPQVELRTGGSPLPDVAGVAASRAVGSLADDLGAGDRLLVLVSGDTRGLPTLPVEGVAVADVTAAWNHLTRGGLVGRDRGRVLAAVDRLGGGELIRRAAPARILGIVQPPRADEADNGAGHGTGLLDPPSEGGRSLEILLRRRGLWEGLPPSVRSALSTREAPAVPDVDLTLRRLAGGETLPDAVARAARRRGYQVRVLSRELEGEARSVGAGLARAAMAVQDGVVPGGVPACLLVAGRIHAPPSPPAADGLNRAVSLGAVERLQGREGVVAGAVEADGVQLAAALVTG